MEYNGNDRVDKGLVSIKKGFLIVAAALFVFGAGRASAGGSFTDVSPDAWYYQTVKSVATLGIMKGDPDGKFRPNDTVTRAELAQVTSNTVEAVKAQNIVTVNSAVNVIAKTLPSTVRIDTADNRYGSGFFVSDNLVLTNWHVAKYGSIRIQSSDGNAYNGEVIKKDEFQDMALIKVDLQGVKVKPLQFATKAIVGEDVIAIGTPQGFSFNVTKGIISSSPENTNRIRFDAAINPGNSGGALIDMDGNVVGVVAQKMNFDGSSEGLGFVISYDEAKKFVEGK